MRVLKGSPKTINTQRCDDVELPARRSEGRALVAGFGAADAVIDAGGCDRPSAMRGDTLKLDPLVLGRLTVSADPQIKRDMFNSLHVLLQPKRIFHLVTTITPINVSSEYR
jgi:hypothetical protein